MENGIDKTLIMQTLERIRIRIVENINSKGLRASGKTERSMRIVETDNGGRLYGRQYFQSLELGRPPGRVPQNFVSIIRQWIIDKGLSYRMIPYKRQPSERWQPKYSVQERSLNAAAGAIAHNIAWRGTTLFRAGGRRDIYTPVIAEEIDKLKKELTIDIVRRIKQTYHG